MKYFKCTTLLILIFLTIPILSQDKENSSEVRFIVLGDSQFADPPQFERMIHEADMLRPAFVIQVGDLIHGYTKNKEQLRKEWRRYKNQISALSVPFYPVPGNHDVVTDEAEEVYAEVWGNDKYYYSFDKGSAHFIVLDSWWKEEDDRISQWQRDWLKKDLEKYAEKCGEDLKNRSIFVFLHSPLWKYPKDHNGRQDIDKVHEILKNYPTKLVVAGHSHEYVWKEKDSINYLVINSAGVRNPNFRGGKFSSFLNVTVTDDGKVSYGNIKAGSVLPLDSVDPEQRKTVPKYNIKEIALQVRDWIPGQPVDMKIEVPIKNNLDENRTYRLDWFIPKGVDVKVEPESMWIEVPGGEEIIKEFHITSENASGKELLPRLEITSKKSFRTGYVSREWEKKYREEKNTDKEFKSSIKLDESVTFKGEFRLFIPPVLTVKRIDGDVKLDGKITENVWSKANEIKRLYYNNGKTAEHNTSVKILYDDSYLYVAAEMKEPNVDELRAEAEPPIPLTWDDDDFEMFFDPAQTQSDYYRLFQNAAGTRFNSLPRWHPDKYFESDYESAIFIGEDYWSIEMIIPWSDIALDEGPESGDEWGFNAGRHRSQSYEKETRWSGHLYDPKRYGVLIFE